VVGTGAAGMEEGLAGAVVDVNNGEGGLDKDEGEVEGEGEEDDGEEDEPGMGVR
jgi:hypothetical protein